MTYADTDVEAASLTGEVSERSVARALVENLERQGVQYVFGIPGAKVDKVFDVLHDSEKIRTIVCRHEQNAAFIAGGIGRLTGKAGVVAVTSGPGCSNLVTGLATANAEGDPVLAIGGSVPLRDKLKRTHQTMDTVNLLRPVTKFAAEVDSADVVSEVIAEAFRQAESGRPGAAFISLPSDISSLPTRAQVLTPVSPAALGAANSDAVLEAARMIDSAERPVLLLGLLASQPDNAQAIRQLIDRANIAVASNFQAAGVVPSDHFSCFAGRVGLFHNQIADQILDNSDLVIAVGYDPIEYDPSLWNRNRSRKIVHINVLPADTDKDYRPALELIGDIALTLKELQKAVSARTVSGHERELKVIEQERQSLNEQVERNSAFPLHPLKIIRELQNVLSDDVTVCVDIGSFYIWIARYLYSFRARQILVSNGQQTLGVGLPWAIAASLTKPSEKVISISGDGGFLFSSMELETAVRLKCNFVHLIWIDGGYNMVEFQAQSKYGRTSAVSFGAVDVVQYANAFGAHGFSIKAADELRPTLKKAMDMQGPVLIGIPVDYSDNLQLMQSLHKEILI